MISHQKVALITGIIGQYGAYLVKFILDKCYKSYVIKPPAPFFNSERIDHIYQEPHINHLDLSLSSHYSDLTDTSNPVRIISKASLMKFKAWVNSLLRLFPLSCLSTLRMSRDGSVANAGGDFHKCFVGRRCADYLRGVECNRSPNWRGFKVATKAAPIFDGGNLYETRYFKKRGTEYHGIGRVLFDLNQWEFS